MAVSWQSQFDSWVSRPFPSCGSLSGGYDAVIIDMEAYQTLSSLSKNPADTLAAYKLRKLDETLHVIMRHLSGECYDYFGQLEDLIAVVFDQKPF